MRHDFLTQVNYCFLGFPWQHVGEHCHKATSLYAFHGLARFCFPRFFRLNALIGVNSVERPLFVEVRAAHNTRCLSCPTKHKALPWQRIDLFSGLLLLFVQGLTTVFCYRDSCNRSISHLQLLFSIKSPFWWILPNGKCKCSNAGSCFFRLVCVVPIFRPSRSFPGHVSLVKSSTG